MPVLVGRIGRTNINCLLWVGVVSRSEALGFPARIDPTRPEFGCRWISYFDPGADLSELDIDCLVEVRERLRRVVSGLAAKGELRMMLVSDSKDNDALLATWQAMTTADPAYPSNPVFLHNIHSASHALGLSTAEADSATLWIETQVRRLKDECAQG